MPTMADVARHAGVSAMSVSRALKDSSQVSKATRERIFKSIDELGYVLDLSAGSLSSKRTGFVAAIIPSINNSNFSDTARGITEGLEGTGLQLLLAYNDYSVEREEGLIEAMLKRRPEGIILTSGIHTPKARRLLEYSGIPVVETWDMPDKPIDQVVGFSNAEAMAELVRTLVRKGYSRFAYIGGTTERDTRGNQRREGFRSVLGELGLDPNRLISFGVPPISMEQGGQAIVSLLDQWPETEVAICVSDLSAFGALMECHRRGLKVPGDIAIAGFGNYEIASCCYPRITSVDIECHEIGLLAARKIIESIQRPDASERRKPVIIDIRVIEREST
jgi:LacI family transcriptional regulator, gluconate utilization system Gnt-I transcriptional repressor